MESMTLHTKDWGPKKSPTSTHDFHLLKAHATMKPTRTNFLSSVFYLFVYEKKDQLH